MAFFRAPIWRLAFPGFGEYTRAPRKTACLPRHTTRAGLAVMAVTARLGPARNLKSQCAPFLVADTDSFFHLGKEDFPVANASG
jgi:hypothetical protein